MVVAMMPAWRCLGVRFFLGVLVLFGSLAHIRLLQDVLQKSPIVEHITGEAGMVPSGHLFSASKKGSLRDKFTRNGGSTTLHSRNDTICQVPPTQGPEGVWGFQALKKIRQFPSGDDPPIRLLCIVHCRHSDQWTAVIAAAETYGSRCDGFLVFDSSSNTTSTWTRKSVLPSHVLDVVPLRTTENATAIWTLWNHVHEHYASNYHFFHFGGTDMYVVAENLRYAASSYHLARKNHGKPLYMGSVVVKSNQRSNYCSDKPGYTLNPLALSRFLLSCKSLPPTQLQDDEWVGFCLANQSIPCIPSVDNARADRYRALGALDVTQDRKDLHPGKQEWVKRVVRHQSGISHVAQSTASFYLGMDHLLHKNTTKAPVDQGIRRYHAIVYNECADIWDVFPGAADAHGKRPYVHDTRYVKKYHNAGRPSTVCELPLGEGVEGKHGAKALAKVSRVNSTNTTLKRILCMVYTHSGRHDRVRAIAETYGPRCDGFLAASNLTDQRIGAVNILHRGPEAYSNMWAKVQAIWKYVYDHYKDDYDFFHLGGDDMYVIAENLRYLVSTGSWRGPWNQSTPLYLGGSMVDLPHTRWRYCGGGSGYTLNRQAVQRLVEDLFPWHDCWPHFEAPDEDRIVASCFRSIGLECMDTQDDQRASRYHQSDANQIAMWNKEKRSFMGWKELELFHHITTHERLDQISNSSVAFHLKRHDAGGDAIRRYHALLYGLCPNIKI